MISASKTVNSLIQELEPRQKEVIWGRFGLTGPKEGKTLAEIGENLGVTRERVRQIEAAALGVMRVKAEAIPALSQIMEKGKKYLKGMGGFARSEKFLDYAKSFAEGITDNHVALLTEINPEFHTYREDEYFWPFYYVAKPELKNCLSLVDSWVNFLNGNGNKEKALSGAYKNLLESFTKAKKVDLAYVSALEGTLQEWSSTSDDKAYGKL